MKARLRHDFESRLVYGNFALMMLVKKHLGKVCITLSDRQGQMMEWNSDSKLLYSPELYINECMRSSMRFVFVPLTLKDKTGGHANGLFIDKKLHEAERFDPQGALDEDWFASNTLDEVLRKYLSDKWNVKYVKPLDYCPKLPTARGEIRWGPQFMESFLSRDGFCLTWTIMYIDRRLQYPNVSRKDLLETILEEMFTSAYDGSLENDLAEYMNNVRQEVYKYYPELKRYLLNYGKSVIPAVRYGMPLFGTIGPTWGSITDLWYKLLGYSPESQQRKMLKDYQRFYDISYPRAINLETGSLLRPEQEPVVIRMEEPGDLEAMSGAWRGGRRRKR